MHVRTLLHCETLEQFEEKYNSLKRSWSESFLDYFQKNIYDAIVTNSGRWVLEKHDLYNPYSGVTNNVVESINAKIKRLVEYQERRIDEMVLYFYYMQANDMTDIVRGFCGESEWTISNQLKSFKRDPDTIIMPKNVCHPKKMIQIIKSNLSVTAALKSNIKASINVANDSDKQCEDDGSEINVSHEIEENCDSDTGIENDTKIQAPKGSSSQTCLAYQTLSNKGIALVPEMSAFMVKGSKDKNYTVKLFPKPSCNCPSVRRCYHIVAVMIAIGMPIEDDTKKLI